jgi:hypothetical protein
MLMVRFQKGPSTAQEEKMWIDKNINSIRLAIVLLAITALIIGPWVFESLWVPGDFPCNPPTVRLKDNFCGLPIQGIDYILWWAGGFVGATASLASGDLPFIDWIGEGLLPLIFLFPLVPLFSSLTLMIREDKKSNPIFNIISWGIALGICLWIGVLGQPRYFYILWGLWLYIGLSVAALWLERFALKGKKGIWLW